MLPTGIQYLSKKEDAVKNLWSGGENEREREKPLRLIKHRKLQNSSLTHLIHQVSLLSFISPRLTAHCDHLINKLDGIFSEAIIFSKEFISPKRMNRFCYWSNKHISADIFSNFFLLNVTQYSPGFL